MIHDEGPERITELWTHLFGDLGGYLFTFTGRQSVEPSAQSNELDDTRQRSWTWPAQKDAAADYRLELPVWRIGILGFGSDPVQRTALGSLSAVMVRDRVASGSTSSGVRATARRRTPRRS